MVLELIRKTTYQGTPTYYVILDGILLPGSTSSDLEEAMHYFEYAKKRYSKKDEVVTLIREEI